MLKLLNSGLGERKRFLININQREYHMLHSNQKFAQVELLCVGGETVRGSEDGSASSSALNGFIVGGVAGVEDRGS